MNADVDNLIPEIAKLNFEKNLNHNATAAEVCSLYKIGVHNAVEMAKIVFDYEQYLSDPKEIVTFRRNHLKWDKTNFDRFVAVGRYFGDLPEDTIDRFELAALFLLAEKRVDQATREQFIQEATSGKIVTLEKVRKSVGKKTVNPLNPQRPGSIRIDHDQLIHIANKLDLNPSIVLNCWERLGINITYLNAKKEAI